MQQRYYFVIRYLPEHADNELLAGRCISNMHGFLSHERNKTFKNSVGVCFPGWTETTVGNEIAFVSSHESILTGLSYQPYFSTMVNEGLFDISDIKSVPDEVGEVRFVFNKTIQKIFNGSKRRRIKRAMLRAEKQGRTYIPIACEDREFELFNSIPIDSKSSENQYILHIQRESAVEVSIPAKFNSYGFASNDKWRGTVPAVKF